MAMMINQSSEVIFKSKCISNSREWGKNTAKISQLKPKEINLENAKLKMEQGRNTLNYDLKNFISQHLMPGTYEFCPEDFSSGLLRTGSGFSSFKSLKNSK